jgi:acetyl-CoA carboxylase carboxyl transferase subunit beta
MRELFRRQPRFRQAKDDARQHAPADLWVKCPRCDELLYSKEHQRALKVCQRCGFHTRLPARERIDLLADDDSFAEWDADLRTADPLNFQVGGQSYVAKADETVQRTGVSEAVISGELTIEGRPLAVVVTDFSFFGASMGSVYGEKLVRAAERAIDEQLPLLTISSSGGARMQEGLYSLLQMAKTTSALAQLGAARLPHLSLLIDPCYGGVTASYATVADVIMAEPGARIGFSGPRVIEQVTRQKLPEGFQTAEFLMEHGHIDMVVPRIQIREQLGALLDVYAAGRRSARPARRRRTQAAAVNGTGNVE